MRHQLEIYMWATPTLKACKSVENSIFDKCTLKNMLFLFQVTGCFINSVKSVSLMLFCKNGMTVQILNTTYNQWPHPWVHTMCIITSWSSSKCSFLLLVINKIDILTWALSGCESHRCHGSCENVWAAFCGCVIWFLTTRRVKTIIVTPTSFVPDA